MYTVSLIDYNANLSASEVTPTREELLIYQPGISDEGLAVTEPMLSIAASSAGTFTCKLPVTNYGYDRIIKKVTRAIVKKDNKIIFMGRINSEDKDIYLTETIQAEGALAYLNDSLTDKRVFTASNDDTHTTASLADIVLYVIDNHNAKYPNEPWKQFTLRTCTANFVGRNATDVNSREISYYSVNFFTSMECMSELLGLANAVLKIDYNDDTGKWDVHIYPRYQLPDCSQSIEFGENLLDLVQTYDDTSLCSAVAPFGGDLIQESKEIGEVVAGSGINTTTQGGDVIAEWYPDTISTREKDDVDGPYSRSSTSSNSGYWVFGLYIDNYNSEHSDNPLKRLYISWRGHYLETTIDNVVRCEDCAWCIYDGSGQMLGYKQFESSGAFTSDINELIDLSDPQFIGASHIVVSGWGGLITPIIRRDAAVVEENDKLDITKCDYIDAELDVDGIGHDTNSPYLFSLPYLELFGKIEKKLEYDIEDSAPKMTNWTIPDYPNESITVYGKISRYVDYFLGYDIGENGDDLESNKGDYQIKTTGYSGSQYYCIQYELPNLGDPKRPRGVYISSRMNDVGEDLIGGTYWKVNGMYALYDTSWQPLMWKAADERGFTSVKDEYIDLSDPKCYGAKYIRVGGWGPQIPVNLVPSDDAYARDRLLAQARLYLTSQQWEKVVIEATAVDLNMVSDEWEAFDICRSVNVFSYRHKFSANLPITALDIQLDAFENNNIKLGYDSDEYLSAQLSDNLRLLSVEQAVEEKRRNGT